MNAALRAAGHPPAEAIGVVPLVEAADSVLDLGRVDQPVEALRLVPQPLIERPAEAANSRLPVGPDRSLGERRDLVRQLHRPRMPTIRGSRCVPPSARPMFQRRQVTPNVACSSAIARSVQHTHSRPPAYATPFTAAMVGL